MRALACTLSLALCVLAVDVEARDLRVFPVRHRPVRDLAPLVEPLLTPEGSITIQPQFNLLTVQDSSEAIARVAKLLQEWDVPPPAYRVRVRVLLGTTAPPTPGPAGPLIEGIGSELAKVFHYTSYQEVETIQITAVEGTTVEAEAGGRYHLRFTLRAVAADSDRVQLANFDVSRREQVFSGGTEILRSLLRTTVSLQVGQTAIIAAARSEGASQGLILVLWAEPEAAR